MEFSDEYFVYYEVGIKLREINNIFFYTIYSQIMILN